MAKEGGRGGGREAGHADRKIDTQTEKHIKRLTDGLPCRRTADRQERSMDAY